MKEKETSTGFNPHILHEVQWLQVPYWLHKSFPFCPTCQKPLLNSHVPEKLQFVLNLDDLTCSQQQPRQEQAGNLLS